MRFSYLSCLLLFILPILIFFVTRGVVVHDEGYILHSSERLLQNELPYRDYHFPYTPLSIFITGFSFFLFGPSILSSRILVLFVYLLSSWLIYRLVFSSTKNKLYSTLSLLLFVAWGPTHLNFSWPSVFAICTSLLTVFLLFKFTENRHERYLFFSGLCSFAAILSQQNFGLALCIPIITFFAIRHARNFKLALTFAYGLIWGFIIFAIYLLYTGSFGQFFSDIYLFATPGPTINASLDTFFMYPGNFLKMLLRAAFYLSPLIISLTSLFILFFRRRFHLLYLPLFIVSLYFIEVRFTDYIHLIPILSLIGIPISLFLRYNISSTARASILLFSVVMISLGFQTGLFKGYYFSDIPLSKHSAFYANPKVNVFINEEIGIEFAELTKITSAYTSPGEYIFVYSRNPMLYFLTDRKEPTKYDYIMPGILQDTYFKDVIGNLVAKKVRILILDHNIIQSLPIKIFIKKNYRFIKATQDFDIFILNP